MGGYPCHPQYFSREVLHSHIGGLKQADLRAQQRQASSLESQSTSSSATTGLEAAGLYGLGSYLSRKRGGKDEVGCDDVVSEVGSSEYVIDGSKETPSSSSKSPKEQSLKFAEANPWATEYDVKPPSFGIVHSVAGEDKNRADLDVETKWEATIRSMVETILGEDL